MNSYDTIIIGGGIAGQEAALNLAGMNFKVLIIEKDLSVGGKMIQLSKVFPTLDCAACITTPKMSETIRHPNITAILYADIESIRKTEDGFDVRISKKPRYVKEELCTGCHLCEYVCPQILSDQYNYDMVGRKAIFIPFSLANPKVAVIDIKNCIHCHRCVKVCVSKAIDFKQQKQSISVTAKSVILATGFRLISPDAKPELGYREFPNVIDSLQMDRLIAPTRPYNEIVRPGDGKVPDNIAYVLCVGSRDSSELNACSRDLIKKNPICSQICCMYSIKQAQLLTGALPLVDITVYYMDIRAFGKGYEEFYNEAKGMGVNFVKGKIARVKGADDDSGDLILRYEDVAKGELKESRHDMVVLSAGIKPESAIVNVFEKEKPELDEYGFIRQVDELLNPAVTSIAGVFAAGMASGPKDIPDSILSAGCAATAVASYLSKQSQVDFSEIVKEKTIDLDVSTGQSIPERIKESEPFHVFVN